MTPRGQSALQYAVHQRWPVIVLHGWDQGSCTCRKADCPSPAKHPRSKHGLKDATTDRATIERDFERWPASNVGLLTGEAFDVLDVDGAAGDLALGEVARAAGDPEMRTDGPAAETGRGTHLLFKATGEGNRARLVEQVDWRGRGGYIVAPPSVHATGRRYRWLPGLGPETPLEDAPEWLLDLVRRPAPVVTAATPIHGRPGSYGRRALESELGRLALAHVGGRNDTLNRSAFAMGQLIGEGHLDPGEVAGALLSVALRIGLTEHEAERTIGSGLRRGLEHPRSRTA